MIRSHSIADPDTDHPSGMHHKLDSIKVMRIRAGLFEAGLR